MPRYQKHRTDSGVIRHNDSGSISYIPDAPDNADWVEYQKWLQDGGIPDVADLPPPPDPQEEADRVDRQSFLGLVDNILAQINNVGWDGLTAAQRKTVMTGLLKTVKQMARRMD